MKFVSNCFLLMVIIINHSSDGLSIWKRYIYTPGASNCRLDGGYYNLVSSTPAQLYCVARISNSSGVWGGRVHEYNGHFNHYENGGLAFTLSSSNEQVEVLDIDSSLTSWVPYNLNPSKEILIDIDHPHSSNQFVCRTYALRTGGDISIFPGFLKNGECHTWVGAAGNQASFEVLILNQRSRLFLQYNFQQSFQINVTEGTDKSTASIISHK